MATSPVHGEASATCSFRGSSGGSLMATVANNETSPPRRRRYNDIACLRYSDTRQHLDIVWEIVWDIDEDCKARTQVPESCAG